MIERTIDNPVTGERVTWIETSIETAGARTTGELEVGPGGGVPRHQHSDHEERIEVLEGVLEVTLGRSTRRLGPGEHVVIQRGQVHGWRNPSSTERAKFRGAMTPGNPGFELFLRVLFGLARDGEVRPKGFPPRRFSDLALLTEWDPSILAGPIRLLTPLMRWAAQRARARGRARELLERYGGEEAS